MWPKVRLLYAEPLLHKILLALDADAAGAAVATPELASLGQKEACLKAQLQKLSPNDSRYAVTIACTAFAAVGLFTNLDVVSQLTECFCCRLGSAYCVRLSECIVSGGSKEELITRMYKGFWEMSQLSCGHLTQHEQVGSCC